MGPISYPVVRTSSVETGHDACCKVTRRHLNGSQIRRAIAAPVDGSLLIFEIPLNDQRRRKKRHLVPFVFPFEQSPRGNRSNFEVRRRDTSFLARRLTRHRDGNTNEQLCIRRPIMDTCSVAVDYGSSGNGAYNT